MVEKIEAVEDSKEADELIIPVERIQPRANGVFRLQGIPPQVKPSRAIQVLYQQAESLFFQLAAPRALIAPISSQNFAQVYQGEGLNDPHTPLQHIFPRASHLALFAFTLGSPIGNEIERLINQKENSSGNNGLALGYMLDSIASFCADQASEVAAEMYGQQLTSLENSPEGKHLAHTRVLLYSPGYCGWHTSGQRKLFQYLKPETIGIQLNTSCLMIPLKSISGVLVAAEPDIHRFENNFPFCDSCQTQDCQRRAR